MERRALLRHRFPPDRSRSTPLSPSSPSRRISCPSLPRGVARSRRTSASGLFPTQEIEDQFDDYLAWTKAQGLSRLVAYEPRAGAEDVLPNEGMRQAFEDYLKWAVETDRGLYYAFTTRNFD